MPANLEHEPIKRPSSSEDIQIREEEIPEEIERLEGVKATRSKFTAKVTDDKGKPLIESPETKQIEIVIPEGEDVLETKAKGDTEDSGTWRAKYFLRRIKKALHFGWKIVMGKKQE